MDFFLFNAAIVGLCSLVSFGASWLLTRLWKGERPGTTIFLGALLPTVLIVVTLAIWHIAEQPYRNGGYSPLVFLIYGFGSMVLNLAFNFFAAVLGVRRR